MLQSNDNVLSPHSWQSSSTPCVCRRAASTISRVRSRRLKHVQFSSSEMHGLPNMHDFASMRIAIRSCMHCCFKLSPYRDCFVACACPDHTYWQTFERRQVAGCSKALSQIDRYTYRVIQSLYVLVFMLSCREGWRLTLQNCQCSATLSGRVGTSTAGGVAIGAAKLYAQAAGGAWIPIGGGRALGLGLGLSQV